MVEPREAPIAPAAGDPGAPPRNGLEPLPMERWLCSGRRKDGGPCGAVLMEIRLGQHGEVRIKCPRCGTWHTRP